MYGTFADSAAPATADQVTRDANLIARNLACLGADAAAATADHIRRFWAPPLRSTLFEQARSHADRFSPIARDAIALLQADRTITSATR
jgi:hypothetical protein